jgi:hypothetical protein
MFGKCLIYGIVVVMLSACAGTQGTQIGGIPIGTSSPPKSSSVVLPTTYYSDPNLKTLAERYNANLQALGNLQVVDQSGGRSLFVCRRIGFISDRVGRYLFAEGQYTNEFFGWKTDPNYRANTLYTSIAVNLIRPVSGVGTSPVDFDGYEIIIQTDVVPNQKEWEDEFMSQKMAKYGWKQAKASRVSESYHFYIPFAAAQGFVNGSLSRMEVQQKVLVMLNNVEKIWGPSK